ncbi:hypothetical protein D9M68_711590 [compost metagenome]
MPFPPRCCPNPSPSRAWWWRAPRPWPCSTWTRPRPTARSSPSCSPGTSSGPRPSRGPWSIPGTSSASTTHAWATAAACCWARCSMTPASTGTCTSRAPDRRPTRAWAMAARCCAVRSANSSPANTCTPSAFPPVARSVSRAPAPRCTGKPARPAPCSCAWRAAMYASATSSTSITRASTSNSKPWAATSSNAISPNAWSRNSPGRPSSAKYWSATPNSSPSGRPTASATA